MRYMIITSVNMLQQLMRRPPLRPPAAQRAALGGASVPREMRNARRARAFVHISHVVATPTLRGDGAHRTWRSGTGDGGQVVLRNDSSGQLEETLFWGEKGGSSSGGLHRGHVAKKRRIRMNPWVIYSIG